MFKPSVKRARGIATKTHASRSEPRTAAQKSASITPIGSQAAISCTIRDLTEKGARLSVVSQTNVPDKFLLRCNAADLSTNARVVWRKGSELGVQFLRA